MSASRRDDAHARALALYTRAVQSPEREVELLASRFHRRRGREAMTLREDFSGAGATSLAWIESHDDRQATAVDHDARALAVGRSRAAALDEAEAARLRFVEGDVGQRSDRTFDLIAAMNFSWATLDDRALDTYLRAAADCLEDDGLLALEFFGGPGLEIPHVTTHALPSLEYRFEVRSYEAPWMDAALHFAVPTRAGVERYDDAFLYRFCLRSPEALEQALRAAGFWPVTWLYEDRNGRYVARRGRPRGPLWTALVLSEPVRSPEP